MTKIENFSGLSLRKLTDLQNNLDHQYEIVCTYAFWIPSTVFVAVITRILLFTEVNK